ncbi:hypothetical protein [Mesorhizobium sp. NZP2298]|uniref:hypothetical protein n=1 Tax=Mesorhizobium sp. NZP2298 TaxID=2483403 RepID=UPI0015519C8A|nr:hypothetical protein [Mesorhizobium sp. NZP2298]
MAGRYDHYIQLENIKNFSSKLETEADPAKRNMLVKLLAEETAKLQGRRKIRDNKPA